jgi:hypothetical protein
MPKYKLLLSVDVEVPDDETQAVTIASTKDFAQEFVRWANRADFFFLENTTITLNRDGDRSAANLLAPVDATHYKHHKVPITGLVDTDGSKEQEAL